MPIETSIAYQDLQKVQTIKSELLEVIADKGVDIDSTTPFADYPTKISSISGSDTAACILKINPTPSDATVVFTDRETFLNESSCLQGQSIEYTVSKQGYNTATGTEVMSNSKELNVVLTAN